MTDSGLTDEERAEMFKRFNKPLARSIEYLASLPDYVPKAWENLPQVPFKPDAYDVRKGKQGGKPSRPSKFAPGSITHHGMISDDMGRILPWWFCDNFPNANELLNNMNYRLVKPTLKEPRAQPPYVEGPPCPHEWESHESIEELYKILDTVGCKLDVSDIRLDKVGNKDQKKKQQSDGRYCTKI